MRFGCAVLALVLTSGTAWGIGGGTGGGGHGGGSFGGGLEGGGHGAGAFDGGFEGGGAHIGAPSGAWNGRGMAGEQRESAGDARFGDPDHQGTFVGGPYAPYYGDGFYDAGPWDDPYCNPYSPDYDDQDCD